MFALLAARDPAGLLQSSEFLWVTGALVATLLIGALILSRVERWRKQQLSNSPASDMERLSSFRAMYENGELSKEEYDRIKAREAQRLRERVSLQPGSAASAQKELPMNSNPPKTEPPAPAE